MSHNKKKGQIGLDSISWWLIALGVLAISIIAYMLLTEKGTGMISHLKSLLKIR